MSGVQIRSGVCTTRFKSRCCWTKPLVVGNCGYIHNYIHNTDSTTHTWTEHRRICRQILKSPETCICSYCSDFTSLLPLQDQMLDVNGCLWTNTRKTAAAQPTSKAWNCGVALIIFEKWPLKCGYLYPGSAVCLFSDLAISAKQGINESKQTFGQDMHFYEVNSSLGK